MEDYSINATKATPAINFNLQTGILSINGRSIPEDSVSFFEPLQNIVRQYLENSLPNNTINIRLDYLNSSSTACLLGILRDYEKLNKTITTIVNWQYESEDEDILNIGLNFSEIIDLKFNMIVVDELN
jgi:hypothetical protein